MKLLLTALAVLLLSACDATAETPADETEYLADLAVAGVLDPGLTAENMLDLGYAVCTDFQEGSSWNDAVDTFIAGGMRNGAAMVIVTSAGARLCPEDAPPLLE